jgi:mannose-1-phosphate guanylyltransferase/mannose-6-phosphate isomerase
MLVPVILSGGAGTRLWPVSREAYPKPFIRLSDGKTLLRKTLERAALFDDVSTIVTVTNKEHYFITRDDHIGAGLALEHVYLLEPCARNTAPAIAMAALYALQRFGTGATLLVLPADHLIAGDDAFVEAVAEASRLADQGLLVTFGIPPATPETGYGYIERGASCGSEAFRVKRFVEKPAVEVAQGFLDAGMFLWNSGMFCFKASVFLDALNQCDVALYTQAQACWQATLPEKDSRLDLDAVSFAALPDISVDYAVMEKHREVAVVKAGFQWNDIGSWDALGDLTPADAYGNRTVGEAVLMNTRDCYVQSDSRMVATVGLQNLVIVDTPDALLVADKSQTQDVKRVVQHLKLNDHASHLLHRTVHRPWGTYTVLEEGCGYKIKRVVVKPKASLSLQMHRHRSEHWVVLSGTAKVVNDTKEYVVRQNESTFIAAGHKHRLENPGDRDLVIIEVQTGEYVGEDDIVRFDDAYGRHIGQRHN